MSVQGSGERAEVDANITEFKRKMQDYIQALCGADYKGEDDVVRAPVTRIALESRGLGRFYLIIASYQELLLRRLRLEHLLAGGHELNRGRPELYYGGGAEGYTDYPALAD